MGVRHAILTGQAESVITIRRDLRATPRVVYDAWTNPEQVKRWWGPRSFTAPTCFIDARLGGTFLVCTRSPYGEELWTVGRYRELVEPERLVYTDAFADARGNPVPASDYGLSRDWPDETLVIVTFADRGGGTTLILEHSGVPRAARGSTKAGWIESLDKLARRLRPGFPLSRRDRLLLPPTTA